MNTEIEAKFLDIDPNEIRVKLKAAGAVLAHPEVLMRRKVYEHPTNKQNDWFRVRDEGNKITMSYKQMTDRTLHGTKEICFTVPSFDQACSFLEAAQLKFVSFQETKREKWTLNEAEITIDTWPWIPTFLEIETPTEEKMKEVCAQLGLDLTNATHGSVENVYAQDYNFTEEEVCDWPEITFIPIPDWLAKKKK